MTVRSEVAFLVIDRSSFKSQIRSTGRNEHDRDLMTFLSWAFGRIFCLTITIIQKIVIKTATRTKNSNLDTMKYQHDQGNPATNEEVHLNTDGDEMGDESLTTVCTQALNA
jgi:hypothetical protein